MYHSAWMSYERFAHLHACAIEPSTKPAGATGGGLAAMDAHGTEAEWVVHQQRSQLAAVEVLHRQAESTAAATGGFHPWARLLCSFRLHEAREQLRYTLIRERFVRIPFSTESDDAPGDALELHSYLFRVICEQVGHPPLML